MGEYTPTQPIDDYTPPPPRALRWFVWGMIVLVVLAMVGTILGMYAFREWVPPRYQVVYSEKYPILQVLLPESPAADTTLPTPIPQDSGVALEDLLGISGDNTDASEITEPTSAGDASAAEVAILPTDQPTEIPATPTLMPTATALPATPTPIPVVSDQSVSISAEELAALNAPQAPPSARNFGFQYVRQTWNNCGPANVTMSLSYFGWQEDQTYAQSFLRGGREDKNTSPHEIVDFVNSQTGVRAMYRIGGDLDTLKQLVSAGFRS